MTATTDRQPDVDRPGTGRRLAFLLRPGWISAVIGVLVGSALCFFVLAPWQFSRHHERETQNGDITAAVSAAAVPLDRLLPRTGATAAEHQWSALTADGEYTGDQVAVGLRQNQAGQASFEILAAFRLDDGSILLVDRGYVLTADYSGAAALPAVPTGHVAITGRVQPFQPDPLARPAITHPGYREVRGISATSIPGQSEVRDGFVQLTEASPGVLTAIGVPQVDAGPFLSYAWQWLTFGTMAILALAFFIRREFVDPRDAHELDDSSTARNPTSREVIAGQGTPGQGTAGQGTAGGEPPTGRRRRERFDRSQLYDE